MDPIAHLYTLPLRLEQNRDNQIFHIPERNLGANQSARVFFVQWSRPALGVQTGHIAPSECQEFFNIYVLWLLIPVSVANGIQKPAPLISRETQTLERFLHEVLHERHAAVGCLRSASSKNPDRPHSHSPPATSIALGADHGTCPTP